MRDHFCETAPRGEFVLVLAGADAAALAPSFADALALARELVAQGQSTNQAAKDAAAQTGQPKRALYQALLEDR